MRMKIVLFHLFGIIYNLTYLRTEHNQLPNLNFRRMIAKEPSWRLSETVSRSCVE